MSTPAAISRLPAPERRKNHYLPTTSSSSPSGHNSTPLPLGSHQATLACQPTAACTQGRRRSPPNSIIHHHHQVTKVRPCSTPRVCHHCRAVSIHRRRAELLPTADHRWSQSCTRMQRRRHHLLLSPTHSPALNASTCAPMTCAATLQHQRATTTTRRPRRLPTTDATRLNRHPQSAEEGVRLPANAARANRSAGPSCSGAAGVSTSQKPRARTAPNRLGACDYRESLTVVKALPAFVQYKECASLLLRA